MMTPRGVADVHVYTPERVTARLGVPPEKVPDLIGLKGDTSDSIAGVPGIGDKTAAQLIQQFDSVEGVLEHVDELSPARAKSLREHADQARESKVLATMRRDLDIDCDPTELVLAPPDRSRAAGDVPPLRVPGALAAGRPARRGAARGRTARGRRARSCRGAKASRPETSGRVRLRRGRRPQCRRARTTRSSCRRGAERVEGEIVAHDAKPLASSAADDTLLAAYLIEPGRTAYELDDLAAEYGIALDPSPPAEEETEALVRRAALPLRLAPAHARTARRSATSSRCTRTSSCRSRACWRAMEDAGVRIDTYRMGEITARLSRAGRGARGPRVRAGRRGVHARLDPAGGARPLRAARADARAQGEDGLLHGYACSRRRSATSTRSCP